VKSESEVAQSCPTLSDPMDCRPPVSSIHGIFQASVLEWGAIAFMTTGETIALTRRTFVGKVISLLFNILSRLVITFLPRSKRLLISWLQSPLAVTKQYLNMVTLIFHFFLVTFFEFKDVFLHCNFKKRIYTELDYKES